MEQVVSGSMVGLCLFIAAIKPPLSFERDIKELGTTPDVTYRVERVWRMVPEAEIARQAQESFEYTRIEDLPKTIVFPDTRWWITIKFDAMKRGINIWYTDQQLKSQFKSFYRADPGNWPLYDIGITRNGLPLSIPDELKYSLLQYQFSKDQQTRQIFRYDYASLFDYEHIIGSYEDQQRKLSQWLDDHRNENASAHSTIQQLADFSVDTFDFNIEAFYVYPYLLLIRDGKLLGVLGGNGQFDSVPDDWKEFCMAAKILVNQ